MLNLGLDGAQTDVSSLLVVGAHCDDIEIGCGGSILRILSAWPEASITWVVLTGDAVRTAEARLSAAAFAPNRPMRLEIGEFTDGYVPYQGAAVKDFVADLARRISPDVIFVPNKNDAHQDHRFAAELIYQTFRDHLILEYEIPKYDGDMGSPNVYVQLSREIGERKIAMILEQFPSQNNKEWFTADTFRSLLRLRGIEARAPEGLAEAFYCRKLLLA